MYDIPPLNYNYDSLEPYIDGRTVKIHYELHHRGYLNKLNEILSGINYNYEYTLPSLINHIDEFPIEVRDDILFYAGGILNHNLYWTSIGPLKNTLPVGKLKIAIDNKYGNFEKFKAEFIRNANLVQGSGYTFLVITPNNDLEIINTPNQETPYLYGLKPIMTIDLWEHSYYLLYQNRRADYINNYFNIVDFSSINRNYEEQIKN